VSESQRHAAHGCEAGGGDEANLIVAVIGGMSVAVADGGVNPSAGGVVTVEEVREREAEDHFAQAQQSLAVAPDIEGVEGVLQIEV